MGGFRGRHRGALRSCLPLPSPAAAAMPTYPDNSGTSATASGSSFATHVKQAGVASGRTGDSSLGQGRNDQRVRAVQPQPFGLGLGERSFQAKVAAPLVPVNPQQTSPPSSSELAGSI